MCVVENVFKRAETYSNERLDTCPTQECLNMCKCNPAEFLRRFILPLHARVKMSNSGWTQLEVIQRSERKGRISSVAVSKFHELLPHAPYSPDSPPSLFSVPKSDLLARWKKITSNTEVIAETNSYFVELEKCVILKV